RLAVVSPPRAPSEKHLLDRFPAVLLILAMYNRWCVHIRHGSDHGMVQMSLLRMNQMASQDEASNTITMVSFTGLLLVTLTSPELTPQPFPSSPARRRCGTI